MLARATAATPWGIDARPIQIEVDVRRGLPQTQIVGLPDTAVRESRERVRAAVKNCGFDLPPRAVTINLAPADLRKEGNHLDLGDRPDPAGRLRRDPPGAARGPAVLRRAGPRRRGAADPRRAGDRRAGAAAGGARAAAAGGQRRRGRGAGGSAGGGPRGLAEAIDHLGRRRASAARPRPDRRPRGRRAPSPISPTSAARTPPGGRSRSLPPAATTCCLIGPPGSGKTMLARRMPGLLPPLTAARGDHRDQDPVAGRRRAARGPGDAAAVPRPAHQHLARRA